MEKAPNGFTKRFWLALGILGMMTLMASGHVFAAALAPEEEADLLYMREEEKLARDVYLALYDKWHLTVFSNISKSEQTHMDAIWTLLDRYDLGDPVQGPGFFTNQHLQEVYDGLIAKGTLSVHDALEVGVLIEETDIEDLKAALTRTTHKDIVRVYTNLKAGSVNHLKAFNSQLANL